MQRRHLITAGMALAATPLLSHGAGGPRTLGHPEAGHLLRRFGFGYNGKDAQFLVGKSVDEVAQEWISSSKMQSAIPLASTLPVWYAEPIAFPDQKAMSEEERKAYQAQQGARVREMGAWWIGQMINSPWPAAERLTLFWHNHFTSSIRKVRAHKSMLNQNLVWRENSFGNLATFAFRVITDPAMLQYLDAARSTKEAPNENFARELLELFLLGEGNYSEADIKGLAKALTGLAINPRADYTFTYTPRRHDSGNKTILGIEKNFEPHQVIEVIFSKRACAEFFAKKFCAHFIGPKASDQTIKTVAETLWNTGYEIAPALSTIIRSSDFWDPAQRGQLIKSPAEFCCGIARYVQAPPITYEPIFVAMNNMEQRLFDPPNVRGWPGGEYWINSKTLAERRNFAQRTMQSRLMNYPAIEINDSLREALAKAHLATDIGPTQLRSPNYAKFHEELFCSPEFQVT